TKALGMFQQSPDAKETLLGLPLSFDTVRPPFKRSAPELGADTDDIQREYREEQVAPRAS
ncbi:MAG TPA: hypothetical protein VLQ94_02690, partial [Candidatus Binatia bacterium]|nr:hypothetical protein [Candidatus Binatia bacterium]